MSVGFSCVEAADAALPPQFFDREPLPYDAAFLAGKCFQAYRKRGGERRSPLADFFIGAHAVIVGYSLLPRDVVRYRTYLPLLPLRCPD